MASEVQKFTSDNLLLVKELVSEMFSPESFQVVEQALENPVLKDYPDVSPGELVVQDGKPVAFRMAILRRLYFGKRSILGVVGSTLCSKKGTHGVLLLSLLKKNVGSRGGSEFFFTNTSCEASGKLNRAVGVKGQGPASSANDHVSVVRQISTAVYLLRKVLKLGKRNVPIPSVTSDFSVYTHGVIIKRVNQINQRAVDDFWQRYLISNKGLVCSRTGAEVQWMFGKRIKDGTVVMLQAQKNEKLVGYVMLRFGTDGVVRIMDIIAIDNEHYVLKALLKGTRIFIRQSTRHFLLKIAGYPPGHSDVFEEMFTFKRPFGYNPCLYKFEKGCEIDFAQMISKDSWFFGPYDGDLAMG